MKTLPLDTISDLPPELPLDYHAGLARPSTSSNPTPVNRCAFCQEGACLAQQKIWGCEGFCDYLCDSETCDYVCPKRASEFVDRWREVDGWPPTKSRTLLGASPSIEWPSYLPLIQHGSRFGHIFDAQHAAIPTFRALATTRKEQLDAAGLRQRFRLCDDAKLMAISVAQDPPLERYWSNRNKYGLAQRIAEWNLSALTIPNFSFFTDAPPWHTHWNFHRMLKVAEEFSQLGIPIVPHVNCLDENHRRAWAAILREQPQLTLVAKEFQTGSKVHEIADQALLDICRLQDEVGRPLHPIAVGGGRLWNRLRSQFDHFTVIDSQPFMLTIYRQEIIDAPDGVVRSKAHPLPKGTRLDELWRLNLARYSSSLKNRESPQRQPLLQVNDQTFQAAFKFTR